ncbi:MAG: ATP-binding cassette domain-containing protein [Desulfobacterales bacterium]|nr:ATP-binding cassette domain-containing protein [Desulfobacterales bacterium]
MTPAVRRAGGHRPAQPRCRAKARIVSLIGPNGAGKTSVFNCLTGFYRANAGDIRFNGESIMRAQAPPDHPEGMARTFQNLRLFKNMTVLENVHVRNALPDHSRRPRGHSAHPAPAAGRGARSTSAAEECLDFVGILDAQGPPGAATCPTATSAGVEMGPRAGHPAPSCCCSTSPPPA